MHVDYHGLLARLASSADTLKLKIICALVLTNTVYNQSVLAERTRTSAA